MFRLMHKHKAQSTVEYMVIIAFVIGAMILFQKYIARAISGRYKATGDSFASGRLYDPNKTIDCAFDFQYTNSWYNQVCFDKNCHVKCFSSLRGSETECTTCINQTCKIPECEPEYSGNASKTPPTGT